MDERLGRLERRCARLQAAVVALLAVGGWALLTAQAAGPGVVTAREVRIVDAQGVVCGTWQATADAAGNPTIELAMHLPGTQHPADEGVKLSATAAGGWVSLAGLGADSWRYATLSPDTLRLSRVGDGQARGDSGSTALSPGFLQFAWQDRTMTVGEAELRRLAR